MQNTTAKHESTFSAAAATGTPATGGTVTYCLVLPMNDLSLDKLIDQILAITLERCRGNKSEAAKILKISRKMFYRKGVEQIMKKAMGE